MGTSWYRETTTLAKIALTHINKGHRVLMVSHSNISVDSAIQKVHTIDKSYFPGKLLRYGYPKDKNLITEGTLTSYNYVINKYHDLNNERTMIEKQISSMNFGQRASTKYLSLTERLNEIKAQLKSEEKRAVTQASFVGTTVSKATVDTVIYQDSSYDVVIFDEASMAYIPHVIFAASIAKKHFICLGDFNQLPPIVQNKSAAALCEDIFSYCGIKRAVDQGCTHEWLCMLNTQYRMHPDIAAFASHTMYHDFLRSDDNMEFTRRNIVDSIPFQGNAINLVDLSGMMTVCQQTSDYSRINPLSAFISIGIANQLAESHSVGIITPYNAQSRLIHAMVRDFLKTTPTAYDIKSATVHQFQGSEEDVIIYDAVDCYRQSHPSLLLTSTEKDYANRLFNVAITRAKGKFIALANVDYLKKKNISSKLMFSRMISMCNKSNCTYYGDSLSSILKSSNHYYQYLSDKLGTKLFLEDLQSSTSSIYIDIPETISQDYKLIKDFTARIDECKKRGVKIHVRAEQKSSLPAELKPLSSENVFVWNAITIIDKKIVWFGEPLSNSHFISKGEKIATQYRPIIRLEGRATATSLFKILKMDDTIDTSIPETDTKSDTFAQYVRSHCICKHCGNGMILKKKNKFFLACSNYPDCNNTEPVTLDVIEEYLIYAGKKMNGNVAPNVISP